MKYSPEQRKAYGEKMREKARKAWHKEFISKTGVRERGWTTKAVKKFLETKLVDAGPIQAYRRKTVERIERSQEFKDFMAANPPPKRTPKEPENDGQGASEMT